MSTDYIDAQATFLEDVAKLYGYYRWLAVAPDLSVSFDYLGSIEMPSLSEEGYRRMKTRIRDIIKEVI